MTDSQSQPGSIINLPGLPEMAVRSTAREPVRPEPIVPPMPTWLSPKARAIWKQIAPELEKNALLVQRDQMSFAMMCENGALVVECLDQMRADDRRKGHKVMDWDEHHKRHRKHPAFGMFLQAQREFVRWAHEFGLSPLGRMRIFEGIGLGGPPRTVDREGVNDDDDALFA